MSVVKPVPKSTHQLTLTETWANAGVFSTDVDLGTDLNDDDILLSEALSQSEIPLEPSTCDAFVTSDVEFVPGFDVNAGHTWIYPTNYPIREYQFSITRASLFSNTLVVLPTGLGKTFIASVLMYNFYRWYPLGKIVFMAPTRTLVTQQIEACYNIMGMPQVDTIEMTGTMNPATRDEVWRTKRVFFLTPQVMSNDLNRGALNPSHVKCLVIDEAHKAQGNHAYCQVVRELSRYNNDFRVLALSATPGSDLMAVQSIMDNLLISHIELRSEDSLDIQPYTHERIIEKRVVMLGDELKQLRDKYLRIIEVVAQRLANARVLYINNLLTMSKFMILQARTEFRQNPPASLQRCHFGAIEGDFALCTSLYHGLELLLLHGEKPFYIFLQGIVDGEKSNARARSELMRNEAFIDIMVKLRQKYDQTVDAAISPSTIMQDAQAKISTPFIYSHPKQKILEDIVVKHFKDHAEDSTRIMIFSQYRDSVSEIANMLSKHAPLIRVMSFIGQSAGAGSRSTKGFTQKEQIKVVKEFRQGGYNTLVATCVGEEGLDIGDVDLIVCYDSQKSPIRLVQRMGRTGRKRQGRIVVLVTEGKEEKMYCTSQYNKRSIHKALAMQGKSSKLRLYPHNPRMIPRGLNPSVHKMPMTIGQYQTSKKTAYKKGKISERSKEDAFYRAGDTKNLDGFLTEEEHVFWSEKYALPEADISFMPTSHWVYLKKNNEQVPAPQTFTRKELSLSKWMPWQNRLQETCYVDHSTNTKDFVELVTFIQLQEELGDEDIYGMEMAAYLDYSDVLKPGIKSNEVSESGILKYYDQLTKETKDAKQKPKRSKIKCTNDSDEEFSSFLKGKCQRQKLTGNSRSLSSNYSVNEGEDQPINKVRREGAGEKDSINNDKRNSVLFSSNKNCDYAKAIVECKNGVNVRNCIVSKDTNLLCSKTRSVSETVSALQESPIFRSPNTIRDEKLDFISDINNTIDNKSDSKNIGHDNRNFCDNTNAQHYSISNKSSTMQHLFCIPTPPALEENLDFLEQAHSPVDILEIIDQLEAERAIKRNSNAFTESNDEKRIGNGENFMKYGNPLEEAADALMPSNKKDESFLRHKGKSSIVSTSLVTQPHINEDAYLAVQKKLTSLSRLQNLDEFCEAVKHNVKLCADQKDKPANLSIKQNLDSSCSELPSPSKNVIPVNKTVISKEEFGHVVNISNSTAKGKEEAMDDCKQKGICKNEHSYVSSNDGQHKVNHNIVTSEIDSKTNACSFLPSDVKNLPSQATEENSLVDLLALPFARYAESQKTENYIDELNFCSESPTFNKVLPISHNRVSLSHTCHSNLKTNKVKSVRVDLETRFEPSFDNRLMRSSPPLELHNANHDDVSVQPEMLQQIKLASQGNNSLVYRQPDPVKLNTSSSDKMNGPTLSQLDLSQAVAYVNRTQDSLHSSRLLVGALSVKKELHKKEKSSMNVQEKKQHLAKVAEIPDDLNIDFDLDFDDILDEEAGQKCSESTPALPYVSDKDKIATPFIKSASLCDTKQFQLAVENKTSLGNKIVETVDFDLGAEDLFCNDNVEGDNINNDDDEDDVIPPSPLKHISETRSEVFSDSKQLRSGSLAASGKSVPLLKSQPSWNIVNTPVATTAASDIILTSNLQRKSYINSSAADQCDIASEAPKFLSPCKQVQIPMQPLGSSTPLPPSRVFKSLEDASVEGTPLFKGRQRKAVKLKPESPSTDDDHHNISSPWLSTARTKVKSEALVLKKEHFAHTNNRSVEHSSSTNSGNSNSRVTTTLRKDCISKRKKYVLSRDGPTKNPFLEVEAELSEVDGNSISSDEEEGSDLDHLDGSFIDDDSQLMQTSHDMKAVYLKSVKSPLCVSNRYRTDLEKPKRMDIFSQAPCTQDLNEDYEEDSFCVGDDFVDTVIIEPNHSWETEELDFEHKNRKMRKPVDTSAKTQDRHTSRSLVKRKRKRSPDFISSDNDEDLQAAVAASLITAEEEQHRRNDVNGLANVEKSPFFKKSLGQKTLANENVLNGVKHTVKETDDNMFFRKRCQSRLSKEETMHDKSYTKQLKCYTSTGESGKVETSRKSASNTPGHSKKNLNKSGLASHMTVVSPIKPSKPVILASWMEMTRGQELINTLRLENPEHVFICRLQECDYIVSDRMGVERRFWSDMGADASALELCSRIRNMCDLFDRVCLIAEQDGSSQENVEYRRTQIRKHVDVALASLNSAVVKVVYTGSHEHTAKILTKLAESEYQKGRSISVPVKLPPAKQKEFKFYQSLPKVSYATALNLCYYFHSIQECMSASMWALGQAGKMVEWRSRKVYEHLQEKLKSSLTCR